MENIRVVEGKQVYLRYMTVEDTDMILRWRNSPIVRDNFIYRKEITREEENKLKKDQLKKVEFELHNISPLFSSFFASTLFSNIIVNFVAELAVKLEFRFEDDK